MTRRLIAGYLILTVVVLVVLMVPLGITHQQNLEQDLLLRMERDAGVVASLVQDDLRNPTPANTAKVRGVAEGYSRATGARVAVTDGSGEVVYDTDPPVAGTRSLASRPEVNRALDGVVATGVRYSDTLGTDLLYVAVPVAASGTIYGSVRLSFPGEEITSQARDYWFLLLGVAVVTLLAVALVGWLIARWVGRPLDELRLTAGKVGEGDLAARAPEDQGPPEVQALAHRFNVMVGQVEALVGAQEAFVADASHELRTPLTAMRLRIENLGAQAGDAGQADADAAIAEVDRLSGMVNSLLVLSRAERGEVEPVLVDVSALVAERGDAWADLAAESGVALRTQVARGLRVRVADGLLEQVIDNLVDNAVEASGATGEVWLTAEGEGHHVRVMVTDAGRGMTVEEREHAFDRFWRSPTSRPGAGSGLGLPIVRRLVQGAGGSVQLADAPGGRGLRLIVDLPRA